MASTRRRTSGTAGRGTASTTSASESAARRRAASVLIVTSNPSAQACAAVPSEALAPQTVRPAFSAARSSDPPINPDPTTQTARSATTGEATPFGRHPRRLAGAHPDAAKAASRTVACTGHAVVHRGPRARARARQRRAGSIAAATRSTPRSSSRTPDDLHADRQPVRRVHRRRHRHRGPARQVERQRSAPAAPGGPARRRPRPARSGWRAAGSSRAPARRRPRPPPGTPGRAGGACAGRRCSPSRAGRRRRAAAPG